MEVLKENFLKLYGIIFEKFSPRNASDVLAFEHLTHNSVT